DHLIVVGQDGKLDFGPANIKAEVGDTVIFEFRPKNHSVIQSSYMNPCRPLEDTGGIVRFRPGFVPLPDDTSDFLTFQIRIRDVKCKSDLGYCGQVDHFAAGMLFAITNTLEEDGDTNFAGFVQRAIIMNGTSTAMNGYPALTSSGVRILMLLYRSLFSTLCFHISVSMFPLYMYRPVGSFVHS
ncbi:hypothetical protein BDQ17DRAFT_1242727, partial [Cyathus striatus]